MLADALRGDQVERPGAEPVGGAGQRTDRADLHGVAGEVARERLPALVSAPPSVTRSSREAETPARRRRSAARAAVLQVDERVAGDLLGEPGAALAEHAALAVEQHLGRDPDRLGEGPLGLLEAARRRAVAHRLVLQRALAALVADRAVERVVDQEQLDDAGLRLGGDRRGVLGPDDHARRDLEGAGGLRLRHGPQRPVGARSRDLDEALPAGAGRSEQRVVAEPRDGDADLLGGADDERALGHAHLDVVDRRRDELGSGLAVDGGGCDGRSVIRRGLRRRRWRRPGRTDTRPRRSGGCTRRGSTARTT